MATHIPSAQLMRQANPLLNKYLSMNAMSITNKTQRHLYQIEGYMRYRQGHISYEEMTTRGTYLLPVSMLTSISAGTVVGLDADEQTTYHDPDPIADIAYQSKYSVIGKSGDRDVGLAYSDTIRVDNRASIDPSVLYMWMLAPTHTVRDICDDYHGRVFRGSDVPPPLHIGCNCRIRRLEASNEQKRDSRGKIQGVVGTTSGLLGLSSSASVLARLNEHHIWGNVTTFVDTVNKVNTVIDKTQMVTQAVHAVTNPTGFLIDTVATKAIDHIKQKAVTHIRDQATEALLSQIKDADARRYASLVMQGKMDVATMQTLERSNPHFAKARQAYQTVDRLHSGFNNVNSVSGAIDLFQQVGDQASKLGVSNKITQAANSPILRTTKAKAVILEDGIRGIAKIAMILI